MPKVYMTEKDRRRADSERERRRQDICLAGELRQAAKNSKVSYKDLAKRAEVSIGTVQKAMNKPNEMRIDILRRICFEVGVNLQIYAE